MQSKRVINRIGFRLRIIVVIMTFSEQGEGDQGVYKFR